MADDGGTLAAAAPAPLAVGGGSGAGGGRGVGGGSARVQAARARRRRGGRVDARGGGRRVAAVPIQAAMLVFAVAVVCVYRYVVPSASAAAAAAAVGDRGVAAAGRGLRLSAAAGRQETADADEELDSYGGLCTPADSFLKRPASLALYIPGVLILFLGLAIVTDDYFVSSLDRICEQLRLSDDVAGATFLAAGSSAPELFTSLISVFVTKDEVRFVCGRCVGVAVRWKEGRRLWRDGVLSCMHFGARRCHAGTFAGTGRWAVGGEGSDNRLTRLFCIPRTLGALFALRVCVSPALLSSCRHCVAVLSPPPLSLTGRRWYDCRLGRFQRSCHHW